MLIIIIEVEQFQQYFVEINSQNSRSDFEIIDNYEII